MTRPAEFSVLTKSVGPPGSPGPSRRQRDALLDALPGGDKWTQSPPASGRGHAFETRFWVEAPDAGRAAEAGAALVSAAQSSVGLADWAIVRVHAATLMERSLEHYPGIEARRGSTHEWSIMHRAMLAAAEPALTRGERESLLQALPGPDRILAGAGRTVELRFWIVARDAVEGAARAQAVVAEALAAIGRHAWTTVRLQSASVAERDREAYHGVEARLRAERDA